MRRIYESEALRRDEDDPHTPHGEGSGKASGSRNTAFGGDENRTVNWSSLSHALLPTALRRRGIKVSVQTNKAVYAPDEPVGFRVQFRNKLPMPVLLRVPTPVRWSWAIDGHPEGVRYDDPAPEDPALFRFQRGSRKTFERTWPQRFRDSEREWSPASRGEHTLSAFVAVDDPEAKGLYAETTFRIE